MADLPAFCRIKGVSKPTSASAIGFEVWIPEGSTWNGKFAQIGNGGFGGNVPHSTLAQYIRRGYATAGTDGGHTGTAADAAWALGQPEKVIDFSYRAMKETTDKSKALIAAYTGKSPRRSYFYGCSAGGREALMGAQRYPEDWDGIIVSAPANFWTRQFAGFVWNQHAVLHNEASYIPAAKAAILSNAARKQCGGKDGGLAGDAFLNDPRACAFDPAVTQCKPGQDDSTCLTPAQVTAAKAIYDGMRNPATGLSLAPGYLPGSESAPDNWPAWMTGASPRTARAHLFGGRYFQYFVLGKESGFDILDVNFATDVARADAVDAPVLNATNPDLSAFQRRGGKLIQYIGWDDSATSSLNSINYYLSVAQEMGLAKPGAGSADLKKLQEFYRLFLVPGLAHCGGGPGANVFGNTGQNLDSPDATLRDAGHDIVAALDKWVEGGPAPNRIIATKFEGDKVGQGVAFQRPLCAYPQVAKYDGRGDPKVASSFMCADSPQALAADLKRATEYVAQNQAVLYNPPTPAARRASP